MRKPKTINRYKNPLQDGDVSKNKRITTRVSNPFYKTWKWRKTSEQFRAAPGNELCAYCKKKGKYTPTQCADHNPPLDVLIRRGLDPYSFEYLVPSCNKCNLSKGQSDRKQINSK